MNRHLLAVTVGVALAVTTATSGTTAASASAPQTLGPVVVGWWSAANRNPALPPVVPPDVGPRDLYVAGANALPSPLGTLGPTGAVAVAALRFRLPAGASVDELRLPLAGVQPSAVTVTACRALRPFTAAYAGAWVEAPTYDCDNAGTARLAADGWVFLDGVERLRQGRDLAVVLVPGPLDRVVVAAPDARTLTVNAPTTPTTYLPVAGPLPRAAPFTPSPAGSLGGGIGAVGSPALPGAPLPAAVPPSVPPAATAPVVSAPAPVAAAATFPARPWPALLATLLLALLAFVPLVRPRRGVVATGAAGERGVGRFRSERSGTVHDLT